MNKGRVNAYCLTSIKVLRLVSEDEKQATEKLWR